jgi:hypothetical protein
MLGSIHPAARYTLARFGIFIVTGGFLLLVGVRGLLVPLIALIISGLLSYTLLSKQRDAVSIALNESIARRRARHHERVTREDAYDDAQRAARGED